MQCFDIHNYSASVHGANIQIEGKPVIGGVVIADFTGNNRIVFPAVLSQLGDAQKQELASLIGTYIIACMAGLDT